MDDELPTAAKFAAMNEEILRNLVTWRDLADVNAWAAANGGEAAVRSLLASRKQLTSYDKSSMAVGLSWLAVQEAGRLEKRELTTIELAERATYAAERSAKWAGWAIPISLVALLISVLAYLKS